MRFDPAAGALKLVSGFLFSVSVPPDVEGLFLTEALPVIALNASSSVVDVAVVVERDSNKLSPQLPISESVSWPRLNLGGANEYLFFFFAAMAEDVDNDDTFRSSGGNEASPSSSSSSPSARSVAIPEASDRPIDRSTGSDLGVIVDVETTDALGSRCGILVEEVFCNWGCGTRDGGDRESGVGNGGFSRTVMGE